MPAPRNLHRTDHEPVSLRLLTRSTATGHAWALVLGAMMLCSCERGTSSVATPSPAHAVSPTRGAAGDLDMRVMLSDLASSKACGMIRDHFIGLRSPDHPDVVTGVLWIRRCEITNVAARLTVHIAGSGWMWVDHTKSKAGAAFTVRQYVRFRIAATLHGPLDIFYDRDAHLATLWFTPDRPPAVVFKPKGNIDVDTDDVWSSVIGAVGTAFSSSPEDVARSQATAEGTRSLSLKLAKGFAVTIDLCTGLRRVTIGKPPIGNMGAADIGETWRVPAEIQPGGVMIIGPQDGTHGMTLQANASRGAVRLMVVCATEADTVASRYMASEVSSNVSALETIDVRANDAGTKRALEIKPTTCPLVVIATPLGDAPTRFTWERPAFEIARSTGGPMLECSKSRS